MFPSAHPGPVSSAQLTTSTDPVFGSQSQTLETKEGGEDFNPNTVPLFSQLQHPGPPTWVSATQRGSQTSFTVEWLPESKRLVESSLRRGNGKATCAFHDDICLSLRSQGASKPLHMAHLWPGVCVCVCCAHLLLSAGPSLQMVSSGKIHTVISSSALPWD